VCVNWGICAIRACGMVPGPVPQMGASDERSVMPNARSTQISILATAAILALVSCQEEDTRLFDETGVWTLDRYSLDGSPYQEINQGRKNRFLLRFKPDDAVVAAAACHEQGFEPEVNSSSCTNATLATWSCQCFSYTYEGSRMLWQEFAPGDTPPPVGAVAGGDGTDGGDMEGSHEVNVSAFGETAATYQFDTLPLDLFNSDGDISKHVFQQKAETIWTTVDVNMDGMLDLEMCSSLCFPSEAG
jgi:hypothetical protein